MKRKSSSKPILLEENKPTVSNSKNSNIILEKEINLLDKTSNMQKSMGMLFSIKQLETEKHKIIQPLRKKSKKTKKYSNKIMPSEGLQETETDPALIKVEGLDIALSLEVTHTRKKQGRPRKFSKFKEGVVRVEESDEEGNKYGKQGTNPQEYMNQSVSSPYQSVTKREPDSPLLSDISGIATTKQMLNQLGKEKNKNIVYMNDRIHLGEEEVAPLTQQSSTLRYDYEDSFIKQKMDETFIVEKHFTLPDFPPPLHTTEAREKVNEIATFVILDPAEKVILYRDNLPCLKCRKYFLLKQRQISLGCQRIIKHPLFELLIILVIVANSLTLAVQDPKAKTDPKWAEIAEYIFLGLYTLEFLLKVTALGFILGSSSYMRDGWNVLDFIIIVSGYIYLFLNSGVNLSIVRGVRVLRPLRTISGVEGLRLIVSALIGAIPLLIDTLLILLFFFLVFAIAGLQLWNGVMKARCIQISTGRIEEEVLGRSYGRNQLCGARSCPDTGTLTNSFQCAEWYSNPNYGVTHFDDIFSSILVVFQCITLEGWSAIQIMLQQAFSFFVFLFFVPMVFIGAFFLLNLTLAVIKYSFTTTFQDKEKDKANRRRLLLHAAKQRKGAKAIQLKTIVKNATNTVIAGFGLHLKRKLADIQKRKNEERQKTEDERIYDEERKEMISCMYSKYRGSSTSLPVQGKDLRKEVLKRKSGIISPNDNIVPHLNLDDIETLRTPFYPAETLIIKETEDEYKSERSLQHEKVNKIADLEINPNREEKHEEERTDTNHNEAPNEENKSKKWKGNKKRKTSMFAKVKVENSSNQVKASGPSSPEQEKYTETLSKIRIEQLEENMKIKKKRKNQKNEQTTDTQIQSPTNIEFLGISGIKSALSNTIRVHKKRNKFTDRHKSPTDILPEKSEEYLKDIEIELRERICDSVQKEVTELGLMPKYTTSQTPPPLIPNRSLKKRKKNTTNIYNYSNSQEDPKMCKIPQFGSPTSITGESDIPKEVLRMLSLQSSKTSIDYELFNESVGIDPSPVDQLELPLSKVNTNTTSNPVKHKSTTNIRKSHTSKFKKYVKRGGSVMNECLIEKNELVADMDSNSPISPPIVIKYEYIRDRAEESIKNPMESGESVDKRENEEDIESPSPPKPQVSITPHVPLFKQKREEQKLEIEKSRSNLLGGGDNVPIEEDVITKEPMDNINNIKEERAEGRRSIISNKKGGNRRSFMLREGHPREGNEYVGTQGKTYILGEVAGQLEPHKVVMKLGEDVEMGSRLDVLGGKNDGNMNMGSKLMGKTECRQQEKEYSRQYTRYKPPYRPYEVKVRYLFRECVEEEGGLMERIEEMRNNDPLEHLERVDPNNSLTWSFFKPEETERNGSHRGSLDISSNVISISPSPNSPNKRAEYTPHNNKSPHTKSHTTSRSHASNKSPSLQKGEIPKGPQQEIIKDKRRSLKIIELQKIEANLLLLDPNTPLIKKSTLEEAMAVAEAETARKLLQEGEITERRASSHHVSKLAISVKNSTQTNIIKPSEKQIKSDYMRQQSKIGHGHKAPPVSPSLSSSSSSSNSNPSNSSYKLANSSIISVNENNQAPNKYKPHESIMRLQQIPFPIPHRNKSVKERLSLERAGLQFLSSSDSEDLPPTPPQRSELNILEEEEGLVEEEESVDVSKIGRKWGDARDDELEFAFLQKLKEIHILNSGFKRKTLAQWSGQDVIPWMDLDRAQYITQLLNLIRFFPTGCLGIHFMLKHSLKRIVLSSYFEHFMTLCVLINTVILALDRYPISSNEEYILNLMNLIFGAIFVLELILKLYALGIKRYFSDSMNYLDCSVVIFSILEILFFGSGKGSLTAFRSVRVFRTVRAVRIIRTMRVIRIARLFRVLDKMQLIIDVIGRSIGSFVYIALLLFLILFLYCLLGMQIFGGNLYFPPEGLPRANFDTFHHSFISVFQVLTLENWQEILYNSMRIYDGGWAIIPVVFYITLIFVGNYVLLNLFLAVLLESFLTVEEEDLEEEEFKYGNRVDLDEDIGMPLIVDKGDDEKKQKAFFLRKNSRKLVMDNINEEELDMKTAPPILTRKQTEYYDGVFCQYSLYLFHYENWLRTHTLNIIRSKIFDFIIIIIICLSSIKLIYDTYIINKNGYEKEKEISYYLDITFTVIFSIECLLKSIALGFVFDDGSYLRDSWNQLDFFIIVTSILDLILSTSMHLYQFKILRQLRTLRFMRFISHNSALQRVVRALLTSIGGFISVAFILFLIWFVFGIVGVSLFAGKLQYCDLDKYEMDDKHMCESHGGTWRTHDSNFDNVIESTLTLFIVGSMEGWPLIMYNVADITETEKGPKLDNSYYYSYFLVVFILIGSFFFLNLFVGVIFKKFEEEQRKNSIQDLRLTEEQKQWVDMQRQIVKALPYYETLNIPNNKYRRKLHRIVTSVYFEIFIMICILLNMIQMACLYSTASHDYLQALEIINIIFTIVFILEFLLKISALGKAYWYSRWNIFDFIVVMLSLFDLTMLMFSTDLGGEDGSTFLRIGPQLARVIRVIRVSRFLRLLNKLRGIEALLSTLELSFIAVLNILALLLLIFCMYAILGSFVFGTITTGKVIDDYTNFQNFGYAMLLLIRISTGEDWHTIMYDCEPSSNCLHKEDRCGSNWAQFYFYSFMWICNFVLLNLFVLIIITLFEKNYLSADNIMYTFKGNMDLFKRCWGKYAYLEGGMRIHEDQLMEFFLDLPGGIGLSHSTFLEIRREILLMDLRKDDDGYISFNELLFATMKRYYRQFLPITRRLLYYEELLRMKISKNNSKRCKLISFAKQQKRIYKQGRNVNPFITALYMKRTFQSWRLFTKLHKRKRKYYESKGIYNYKSEEDEPLDKLDQSSPTPTKTHQKSCPFSKRKIGMRRGSTMQLKKSLALMNKPINSLQRGSKPFSAKLVSGSKELRKSTTGFIIRKKSEGISASKKVSPEVSRLKRERRAETSSAKYIYSKNRSLSPT